MNTPSHDSRSHVNETELHTQCLFDAHAVSNLDAENDGHQCLREDQHSTQISDTHSPSLSFLIDEDLCLQRQDLLIPPSPISSEYLTAPRLSEGDTTVEPATLQTTPPRAIDEREQQVIPFFQPSGPTHSQPETIIVPAQTPHISEPRDPSLSAAAKRLLGKHIPENTVRATNTSLHLLSEFFVEAFNLMTAETLVCSKFAEQLLIYAEDFEKNP
ncbi:hypothetical protein FGB62_324g01 [Gracilaria domingensis]|nr:hypothetical protein FGB62_324g01 [Gracilaria domingensis]